MKRSRRGRRSTWDVRGGHLAPFGTSRLSISRHTNPAGVRDCLTHRQSPRHQMRAQLTTSLDHLRQDLRYTARGLLRSRAFTATVMITLGLGIGANTAMFSAIDRLMFRPFPFLRDPGSVNRVYLRFNRGERVITQSQYPYARYLDLRRWTTSFSDAAAVVDWRLAIGPSENGRELAVEGMSASLFHFFDTHPTLGRFFDATEDSLPRGASVAVVGYGYWQSQLGGKNVIGQTLQV